MRVSRTIAVCLLVIGLLPGVALAQVTTVTIRVDGLSCPFCAYSLEKKLQAVEGVAELTIEVNEGIASFVPRDATPVDFATLPTAVKDAGFTPREIRAAGVGRIATVENQPALVDLNGTHLFMLEANDVLDGLNSDANIAVDFAGTVLIGKHDQPQSVRLALTTVIAHRGPEEE